MKKYWAPNQIVQKHIQEYCKSRGYKKILEVCPGGEPFSLSTDFIYGLDKRTPHTDINLESEKFPFGDKEFDFVYCRHVIEDLNNIELCLNEIKRVSNAGYIETPSPIVEITRKVDGGAPPYRGYIHHRYIIWKSGNILKILPKFPCIEYLNIVDLSELLQDPVAWNTYFFWEDDFEYSVLLQDIDFNIFTEYSLMIQRAVDDYMYSITEFKKELGLR